MLQSGETFDRYVVEYLLGTGGMASVYRVRHTTLDSVHAMKVLAAGTDAIRDRLLQEGQTQAQMRHPNLVAVTDVLEVKGQPSLVLEYVDGPTLHEWLRKEGSIELGMAVHLFRGIVHGTRYAHKHGVIHRDLKPENVLLASTPDGMVPKIADFGLVKNLTEDSNRSNTQGGVAMGTPEYMAPEQVRDAKNVDHRADLWSLGCIFYELLCGRPPFVADDMFAVFTLITSGDYTDPEERVPGLPPRVRKVIRTLLQTDIDKRYPDCDALLDDLNRKDLLKTRERTHLHPASALAAAATPAPVRRTSMSSISETRVSASKKAPPTLLLPPPPTRGRAITALLPLMGVPLMLLMLAAAVHRPSPTAPATPPVPVPVAPAPSELSSVIVVEDAHPDPIPKPEPPPPPVEPEPVPDPVPVVVQPEPKPKAKPKPKPKPSTRASYTGDAKKVWLVQGSKRVVASGRVAPGKYNIEAEFPGVGKVSAGSVTIPAGKHVKLKCSKLTFRCRPK